MILPGCIVILSPLIFGSLFGYRFVSGMLAGTITSGIQIAFSASNTGGAWDNCKKYIEAGNQERTTAGARKYLEESETKRMLEARAEYDAIEGEDEKAAAERLV